MAITNLPTPPSRSSPSDFSTKADAFIAALPVFVTEANEQAAALDLNDTTTTSTTSLAIGVGSKTLIVEASKSFQPGMSVKIARTSSPSNWMHGDVTTYSGTTLVVNVTTVLGSGGPFTDWTITFSAPVNTPTATAESDFIIAGASPFTWLKKTLVEAKALLGLIVTAGKTITVTQNTSLDEAVAMSSKLTIPGAWTTPTFDAGNFTGSESMTWTVAAGNVHTYAYIITGKIMIVSWRLWGTTVGGIASTLLKILIPGGKTATKTMHNMCVAMGDGINWEVGRAFVGAGGTEISLSRLNDGTNWGTGSGVHYNQGQIEFEIN